MVGSPGGFWVPVVSGCSDRSSSLEHSPGRYLHHEYLLCEFFSIRSRLTGCAEGVQSPTWSVLASSVKALGVAGLVIGILRPAYSWGGFGHGLTACLPDDSAVGHCLILSLFGFRAMRASWKEVRTSSQPTGLVSPTSSSW
jgi:hypothetical protein